MLANQRESTPMFNLSPVDVPDLSGKTFLITGAGRGIGAVLAGILAENGARVFAGVFRQVEPTWASFLKKAEIIQLDVTDQLDVDHAVSRIRDEAGQLNGLINNAGVIAPIGHVDTIATDGLHPAFNVNVLGVHRMTCAALPMLKASKGVVINAGTGAATTPMEGWAAYCSSKAAVRMLTQMFAAEVSGSGVQFFFLGIPPTDTAMQAQIRESGLNPISQIKREDLVAPEVPASAIAWLCGPEARKLDEALLDVRNEPFKSMMGLTDQ